MPSLGEASVDASRSAVGVHDRSAPGELHGQVRSRALYRAVFHDDEAGAEDNVLPCGDVQRLSDPFGGDDLTDFDIDRPGPVLNVGLLDVLSFAPLLTSEPHG